MEKEKKQIVLNLLRIGAYLEREGNKIAEQFGINQQQFVVLNFIHTNDLITQKEICSSLLYEKSNVSKIIKKLEKLELVSKATSRGDFRYSHLSCTDKGKQVVLKGIEKFNGFNNLLMSSLPDNDIEDVLDSTEKITNIIKGI